MDPVDYNLSSTNTTLDANKWSSNILKKMTFSLYSIIFILGTIGNGLVIWIAGFRMKKTISAVWFLHLAIADLLCCLSLPLYILEIFYKSSYTADIDIFCVLIIFLFFLNMSASVLLLTAMSIDRWVSVMWPFWAKVHRTRKLVRITAGIIWVWSFLSAGVVFYSNKWCLTPRTDNDLIYIKNTKHITRPIRFVILCVIPFLIIVTSYVTIFLKVRKSNRPQRSQRPYRIITAVILCFFICWFPYYIWPLTAMFDEEHIQSRTINTIITTVACLNSCINPIIYVLMGQDFRHGFLRSIPLRLERALDDHLDDPSREDSEQRKI